MIELPITDADLTLFAGNIHSAWQRATPEQLAAGRAWYSTAHDLAEFISGGNVRAGAGVLAALSPQKRWPLNVALATQCMDTNQARGHVRDACAKAERIMLGEDPLLVLPEHSKTWNFFRCIVAPDDPDPIVIDRHAHDVAVGQVYGNQPRGLESRQRYAALALAFRVAAQGLRELPSTVQAVTWVVHRAAISNTDHRGDLS